MRPLALCLTIVVEIRSFKSPLFEGERTVRCILSLQGLAVVVWVWCLAFEGLLAGMAAVVAWHPHFLPVAPMLALVTGRGPGPPRRGVVAGRPRPRAGARPVVAVDRRGAALVPGRPFPLRPRLGWGGTTPPTPC